MRFYKQSGFSLLEIMVAAALLGGLALAGAKLMENQTKSMKTVEVRGEYNAVLTDIRSLLAVEENCTATFAGLSANGAPGPQLIRVRAPDGSLANKYVANPNWRLGAAYGNGQVRILSYRILSPDPTGGASIPAAAPVPPATTKLGSSTLFVNFHFGDGRTVGASTLERRILLNVEVNAGNVIQKCTSTGGLGADARYVWRVGGSAGVMTGHLTMTNNAAVILSAGSTLVGQNGSAIVMQEASYIDFTSDKRFKYDVQSLKEMIPKIRELRPVKYKWKSNNQNAYGVIAQDLAKIFPELVRENGPNNSLTVDYIQLTPLLLRGIQEVDKENLELKQKVQNLQEDQKKIIKNIDELKRIVCQNKNRSEFCTDI